MDRLRLQLKVQRQSVRSTSLSSSQHPIATNGKEQWQRVQCSGLTGARTRGLLYHGLCHFSDDVTGRSQAIRLIRIALNHELCHYSADASSRVVITTLSSATNPTNTVGRAFFDRLAQLDHVYMNSATDTVGRACIDRLAQLDNVYMKVGGLQMVVNVRCAFLAEIHIRGCHWIPRMFA